MSDIQVLQNDEKLNNGDIDIYQDDIDYYLDEYITSRGIEDPYDIRPSQWTAALNYIYQHTFKRDNSSIRPPKTYAYSYDLNAVSALVDRYIYMCQDHNQRVSITGFCTLSGISPNTIYDWQSGNDKGYIYYDSTGRELSYKELGKMKNRDGIIKRPTTKSRDIYKKLITSEGQSLQDSLTDRKRNPMHTLPLWNAFQAKQAARTETPVIDTTNIAEQLGISDQLNALPGE